VENVVNMRRWSRYPEFIEALQGLGYKTAEQVLNAADFGVPQSRRRLFIVCDRRQQPAPIRIPQKRHASAATIIDFNGTYQFSPLRTDRRAKATLARADRAIETLGPDVPFLIVYYGSDQAGGWQGLDRPLRTITTLDRFALVKPSKTGHAMRMLQPAELQKAMGFPCAHTMMHGTRRDRIRMMGNAVCPPVMAAAVKAVIEDV
jgi:DNA (cytosine-5)-methyltransferase 1